ncbi:AAA family ATPase [Streptomyces sp. NPDC020607]|uniref:AAA family ATPase n=1 Tax=Streptomyces sp. NPDC020607 TaxID=3365082 RepID=UPI00378E520B
MSQWPVYTGRTAPHDGITDLPPPPPWRAFDGGPALETPVDDGATTSPDRAHRARTYRATDEAVQLVNAALYLRRPLLITGPPGSGKSSLAYAVARELRLGPVLRWNITSRSTLHDALYQYDPLSRLYAAGRAARDEAVRPRTRAQGASHAPGTPVASRAPHGPKAPQSPPPTQSQHPPQSPQPSQPSQPSHEATTPDETAAPVDRAGVADHLRLGPLGTALLPYARPRALLIDEIDKSDLDLPNDLLNVLEEGQYEIPELLRVAKRTPRATLLTDGTDTPVTVEKGRVRCRAFPFVVLTSNGEREFPPAFLRRCVTLRLRQPRDEHLEEIVRAHLGEPDAYARGLITRFLERGAGGELATDQLLNAIYLTGAAGLDGDSRDELAQQLMPYLSTATDTGRNAF